MAEIDTSATPDAIAIDFPAQYGKVIEQPGLDTANIRNVAGMSGSPVYGLKAVADKLKYWVLGIQCGWFEGSRVVKFHPAICFFDALKSAIQQLRQRTVDLAETQ